LKLARTMVGHSLRDLAKAIGDETSARALAKIERGEALPNSQVAILMAQVLNVPFGYLFSDEVAGIEDLEFRKRSGTKIADRARVEVEVINHMQRYIAIEEILGIAGRSEKEQLPSNRLDREEKGEILAQELRCKWKLGIDPIQDMTALLEGRGIKVLVLRLPKGISGLTCLVRPLRRKAKMPVIVVNQDLSLERRRFTLAHEMAHRLIDGSSKIDQEKASNVFAGAFLVPKEHLVQEIGGRRSALDHREILDLKRIYGVSAASILVRMRQVGIIDESALALAFQTFARRWRVREPDPLEVAGQEGMGELPRRFERLCYGALAERIIDLGKICELLQRPLAVIEQELKNADEGNADSR